MKKSLLLTLFIFLFAAAPARASTLADIPFGSVIQIQPTDTFMCDDTDCATTTNNVLPLRFVKMQARLADGSTLGDVSGFSDNASFGDNGTYTYWMLLDNYCWWGNARCKANASNSSRGQAYNGISGINDSTQSINISMVMGMDNDGNPNLNATDMQNNNFLNALDGFWDSLPATIANQPKANVIPSFTWDMRGNSTANPSVAGWFNAATRPWQTGTYDPTAGNGSDFTFSGTNASPIMTSRIGLPSYTEWQGGTMSYMVYSGQTATNGSGGSFCQARFGTDCTNGGSFWLFSGFGSSAVNPMPYNPWLRSPGTTSGGFAWYISGSSLNSLNTLAINNNVGISPALWLSADISILDGEGTYSDPYCINAADCPTPPPTATSIVNLGISGYISLDCTAQVDLFLPSGYGETERDMTCNVLTNNSGGYTISVESSDNLDNNGNTIPNLGNNSSAPAALTQTGTGARWAITNDMSSSHFGSNVWFSSGQISSSNTASANTGDNYTYRVGASVGANSILQPGTYTGTLTFTATTID